MPPDSVFALTRHHAAPLRALPQNARHRLSDNLTIRVICSHKPHVAISYTYVKVTRDGFATASASLAQDPIPGLDCLLGAGDTPVARGAAPADRQPRESPDQV
jgi:hypothetical protein